MIWGCCQGATALKATLGADFNEEESEGIVLENLAVKKSLSKAKVG